DQRALRRQRRLFQIVSAGRAQGTRAGDGLHVVAVRADLANDRVVGLGEVEPAIWADGQRARVEQLDGQRAAAGSVGAAGDTANRAGELRRAGLLHAQHAQVALVEDV